MTPPPSSSALGGGDLVRGTAKSETGMSSRHSTIPYYTIKAKIAWAANAELLEGIGSFVLVGGGSQALDPGFDIMGDERKFAVKNYHRTDVCSNVSISADNDMVCPACGSHHSYGERITASDPLVVILSDQFFPLMLASRTDN
jgi:hypothetical protein